MKRSTLIGAGIVIISLLALFTVFMLNFGQASHRASSRGPQNAIGVVYVSGTITSGGSGSDLFGGLTAGSNTVMAQIRKAKDDPEVKAVVVRINSPGGSAAASQEIAEEIKKLREAGKIVVTSMGDTAASGGYWIAANTDRIVANPGTLTGSIGVITQLQNLEELYDKIGISYETFTSGPHKDMGSSARSLTDEEREIFQAMVDDIFQQFVSVVAEGRGMTREEVLQLADGRIFTGRQAQEVGLVDDLGTSTTPSTSPPKWPAWAPITWSRNLFAPPSSGFSRVSHNPPKPHWHQSPRGLLYSIDNLQLSIDKGGQGDCRVKKV